MAKPKFIERIMEAIVQLGEKNGSSAKNILNHVRKSNPTLRRNITLQVQRSLKTAVLGGLLKLCGSRYKIIQRGSGGERPVERKPRRKAALPVTSSKKPRVRRQRSVKRHSVSGLSIANGDKQLPQMPPPRQAASSSSSSRPRYVASLQKPKSSRSSKEAKKLPDKKMIHGKTSGSRSKPRARSTRKPIAKLSAKSATKKNKRNPRAAR